MDQISKIATEEKTQLSTSPNTTGVSQSKFLSPCRRVGLKRSTPNKFFVKFKQVASNHNETSENAKQVDANKNSVIRKNNYECNVNQNNEVEEGKLGENIGDSYDKDVKNRVSFEKLSDKIRNSDVESVISNDNFMEKKHTMKKLRTTKHSEEMVKQNMFQTVSESMFENESTGRNSQSPDLMDIKSTSRENNPESCENIAPSLVDGDKDIPIEALTFDNNPTMDLLQYGICSTNKTEDLGNLVLSTVNETSNLSSKSFNSKTNCLDDTETNSSLCDDQNKSNNDCTADRITERVKNVESSQCNASHEARTVKRCKNPMKQNFVVKKIKLDTDAIKLSDIEKRIADKEKKIAEMKVTIANSTKHDIRQLDGLISKWRAGCQEALAQLLAEIQRRGTENYDLEKLLAELKIPPGLLHYSETDQDFY